MTKRMLSMVLSLALLLSCVSGITLFTAAEESELPTPITWYTVDQETGEVTASRTAQNSPVNPYVSTQIPGGNGYGLRLGEEGASDWQGFWIGSDDLMNSGYESATILIEYYIDSSVKKNDQMFRIMPASIYNKDGDIHLNNEGNQAEYWIDYFTAGTVGDGQGNDVLLFGPDRSFGVYLSCGTVGSHQREGRHGNRL